MLLLYCETKGRRDLEVKTGRQMVIHTVYIYQENEENLSLKLQMRHVQNIKCQQEKKHTPNDNFKCYLKRFEKNKSIVKWVTPDSSSQLARIKCAFKVKTSMAINMEKKRNMEHSRRNLGGIYMKWGKKISLFFVIFVFLLNFPASVLFFSNIFRNYWFILLPMNHAFTF